MITLIIEKNLTPVYQQLYNQIQTQILRGKVRANSLLPSIRVVAKELNISVIPVKMAYEMLQNDGYIYTVPAKGCFVAQVDTRSARLGNDKLHDAVNYCKGIGLSAKDIFALMHNQLNLDAIGE